MGQPPKCPEMARFRPPAGVSRAFLIPAPGVRGPRGRRKSAGPVGWIMLWSTMIHHREGPLMQQRLSKLEAAQAAGGVPLDPRPDDTAGELEIEREGRGDRAKVWVLAPGAIQRCTRWPTRRCWSIAGGRVGGGKGAGQGAPGAGGLSRGSSWTKLNGATGNCCRSSGGVRRCWRG